MVICDVTIVIILWRHELRQYKTANLIYKSCVCSDCSTDRLFPRFSPSPLAPLFPETQQY
jgi:hypothetical protein